MVGNAEIVESHFSSEEQAERAGASLKLRSEQPVQGAEVRVDQLGGDAVGKRAREVALEIVRHLGFDLDTRTNIEGRTAAQADEISGGRELCEVEVIGEGDDL